MEVPNLRYRTKLYRGRTDDLQKKRNNFVIYIKNKTLKHTMCTVCYTMLQNDKTI